MFFLFLVLESGNRQIILEQFCDTLDRYRFLRGKEVPFIPFLVPFRLLCSFFCGKILSILVLKEKGFLMAFFR